MDGGSSGGGGGREEWPKEMNKKGMWTLEEDEILTEYVRRHGEGNWNAVQRHTPLQRSGKSCRLRWTNHLRPGLKKGTFSPEEESLVVHLHAEYGNRWAHMASLLPGRTDNEIKNYWNTRRKRIRRANLPMHPHQSRRAGSTESSPSDPSLAVGSAQPPPPFFGPSSSQWSWPGPGQCQPYQLPPQSTIAGLRHHLSAFCAESHPPSRRASVVLPSIQITPLGAMVPISGGARGFFPMPSKQSVSGLLGDLSGESETLVQKEMEKNKRENLGGDGAEAAASSSFRGEPIEKPINEIGYMDDGLLGGLSAESETLALKEMEKYLSESLSDYHAEVTYQATSSLFSEDTKFSGGAPIDEIKCMDDGLLGNLLAKFKTLVPKEMEKNHGENLSSHCAEAAYEATSTSFMEYTQFSGGEPTKKQIDEIDCMDNGLLGNLVGESKTPDLYEMKKNQSDSWSAYHVEATDQATSSSFNEHLQFSGGAPIDEIKCMDDGLLGNLLAKFKTLVPKEMEKNHGENLSSHCAEAAYEATSTSFMEYTQFSVGEATKKQIDEINCMDNGLLGNLLGESKTPDLYEMKKNQSDSWSAYHVEAADQATSSSFNEHLQFSGGAPTEEPIDEIKCMDDGLLGNFLAEFEILVPKEMEKNHGENLRGHRAEAAYEATSTSFTEYAQFSGGEPIEKQIDEINCVDNGLLGNLLGESETLDLYEMKKNQSDSWSAYHVEAADQATSSSFNGHLQFFGGAPTEEPIDEIKCMDDGLLGNLLTEFEILVPKEMEKNHGENLSIHCAEATYEATSTSFTEHAQFSGGEPIEKQIDEIDCVDNALLGNLLAKSKTLALNEMKKNQSDSWSAYHVEAVDQATSSSLKEHIQFFGEEPTKEPIDEIECMDDGLLGNLLAECETLALKEMEKNQSESSSGYRAKAVDQATSSSFSEHTQFFGAKPTKEPIAEIECMDDGLLGDLLAEPETLALKEMEKNKSDSSSGYPMEVADQATLSSFSGEPTEELMDEIQCMNDDLLGLLSSFASTMPSPDC